MRIQYIVDRVLNTRKIPFFNEYPTRHDRTRDLLKPAEVLKSSMTFVSLLN